MSEFLGLEGMDLSDVEVKTTQILGVGRHVVKITDAAVEKDDSRNTARLVLSVRKHRRFYSSVDLRLPRWITEGD